MLSAQGSNKAVKRHGIKFNIVQNISRWSSNKLRIKMEKYCNYRVWGNILWISPHYCSVAFVCHCRRRLSVWPQWTGKKGRFRPEIRVRIALLSLQPRRKGMNKRYTQHKTEEELVAWRNMMDGIPYISERFLSADSDRRSINLIFETTDVGWFGVVFFFCLEVRSTFLYSYLDRLPWYIHRRPFILFYRCCCRKEKSETFFLPKILFWRENYISSRKCYCVITPN